jgi:rhodanese-related sulfurtransferase
MDAGENPYIIDLRTALDNEWPSVPGAVRLSFEDLTANSKKIPRDREVILYCSCPNEAASAHAALLLKSHGITHVRPLQGGAAAWAKMTQVRSVQRTSAASAGSPIAPRKD